MRAGSRTVASGGERADRVGGAHFRAFGRKDLGERKEADGGAIGQHDGDRATPATSVGGDLSGESDPAACGSAYRGARHCTDVHTVMGHAPV